MDVTWLENEDMASKTHVNHKNKDRRDNRAVNLEWTTPKDNQAHAHGHPLLIEDLRDQVTYYYPSKADAAKVFNIRPESVKQMVDTKSLYKGILRFTVGRVYQSGNAHNLLLYFILYLTLTNAFM